MAIHFEYRTSPYPIRQDIVQANRLIWERIARPGNWWSGPERIAIAESVREARNCPLCVRSASAPIATGNTLERHKHSGTLPYKAVEAIHRITRVPMHLDKDWYDSLIDEGFTDAHYVEILGVVVSVVCIDAFHDALGLPLEPLPEPDPGSPSFYRPGTAILSDQAWVPMISKAASVGTQEADLYPGAHTGNVITAMSLAPDAVRLLNDTHTAHYVDFAKAGFAGSAPDWHLSRPQIELIATRVSVLNRCYY